MGVGLYLSHQLRCKYLYCIGDTWRAVSEDPLSGFLLIVRTGRIVTALFSNEWSEYRRILGCPSIQPGLPTAELKLHRYSYGRRLPGLRFRASPEG